MSKVVIISGHPNLSTSYTNSVILDDVATQLPNAQIRKLDALNQDGKFDVAAEQAALVDADIIVLQFPFYWYSVPALMKQWIDDVLAYGFAFGSEGDKLRDKDLILSVTVGGAEESYDPLGYNHFTVEEFLRPLQQTAYLTGMKYHPPVYTTGMVYIEGVYNERSVVEGKAHQHATRLIEQIRELSDSNEVVIEKFVKQWYRNFDGLPADHSFFIDHLGEHSVFDVPDAVFELKGERGFTTWYNELRARFKPGGDHRIEQLEVLPENDDSSGHKVNVRVRYIGEDKDNAPVDILANLSWQVDVNTDKHVTINRYEVKLAA